MDEKRTHKERAFFVTLTSNNPSSGRRAIQASVDLHSACKLPGRVRAEFRKAEFLTGRKLRSVWDDHHRAMIFRGGADTPIRDLIQLK
jgi:hypothetical protein